MVKDTAMAAAFQAAGYDACRAQMEAALALWINNGRGKNELIALVVQRYKDAEMATVRLPDGQTTGANLRSETTSEAADTMPNGQPRFAIARVETPEAAQLAVPNGLGMPASSGLRGKASTKLPNSRLPIARPRDTKLVRDVMAFTATRLARAQLGYILSDGRDVLDVPYGQLRAVAAKSREDAVVASILREAVERRFPAASTLKTVREILGDEAGIEIIKTHALEAANG